VRRLSSATPFSIKKDCVLQASPRKSYMVTLYLDRSIEIGSRYVSPETSKMFYFYFSLSSQNNQNKRNNQTTSSHRHGGLLRADHCNPKSF
jgi:hypothetical protein